MGFVYFIQDQAVNLIKIGCSADCPYTRLNQLRRAKPKRRVELLGVIMIEPTQNRYQVTVKRELHAQFAGLREDGDWFHPGQQLVQFICENARPHFCSRSCPNGTFIHEERIAEQEATSKVIQSVLE